jgi:hypothetical protein
MLTQFGTYAHTAHQEFSFEYFPMALADYPKVTILFY